MADHQNHHRHHRPHRLSVPSRASTPTSIAAASPSFATPRPYPLTPIPTPSKHRLSSLSFTHKASNTRASLSFLFLLLFSLRSLYSLLPFLRSSSPSFSLFPFSFLVSLLSFLLTLAFSVFSPSSSSSSKDPFQIQQQNQALISLSSITQSQRKLLFSKSLLLAVVFLLRFQALRYCGAAAMILAELSGNVAARFFAGTKSGHFGFGDRIGSSKVRGFISLITGMFLLCVSWDRIECFPFSASNMVNWGLRLIPKESCFRVWPMLLPFSSGFLGCYEHVSMNWGTIRQLGAKRIRLISLLCTTIVLSVPAGISILMFGTEGNGLSLGNLGWPLANTVVFGVLLSENFSDDSLAGPKDFQKEFLVTFLCTIILELFYFPELSLWGLLLCGVLLWVAVRELDFANFNYSGLESHSSESLGSLIMKPIRHILSERKSRKIALFLLINTGYMVVEFVAGFMSNSLGLISDACHMLFDCAALAIGLYASYIARLPANNQFNYGRGRFEVLSGYVNAVFLVLVGALIVLESLERILDPQEISTNSLLTVSIGGLVVNIVGLVFFHEEHHHAHGGSGCSHSDSHAHSSSQSDSHIDCNHNHHEHDHGKHSHSHDHGKHSHSHDVHFEHEDCTSHHNQISADNTSEDQKLLSTTCNHEHSHQHSHNDDRRHTDHHHDHPHKDLGAGDCQNKPHSDRKLVEEPQKHRHHHIDHNMEGIFLHVLADTMGSVGVVVSTLLIKYKGWLVADPASSMFISALIISSVIPLLRNSAEILLQRVPRAHESELKEALNDVLKLKGVCGMQNLHVWSFTNTDIVGTLHLHVSTESEMAPIKAQVSHILRDAGVKDLTLQVECIKRN